MHFAEFQNLICPSTCPCVHYMIVWTPTVLGTDFLFWGSRVLGIADRTLASKVFLVIESISSVKDDAASEVDLALEYLICSTALLIRQSVDFLPIRWDILLLET